MSTPNPSIDVPDRLASEMVSHGLVVKADEVNSPNLLRCPVTGPFVRVIPQIGDAYMWFVEQLFSIEDEPSLTFTCQRVINGHELHGSLVLLRNMQAAGGELLRRLCFEDLTDQFTCPCVVYRRTSDFGADAVSVNAWDSHLVVVNRGKRKGSKPFLVENLSLVDIGDEVLLEIENGTSFASFAVTENTDRHGYLRSAIASFLRFADTATRRPLTLRQQLDEFDRSGLLIPPVPSPTTGIEWLDSAADRCSAISLESSQIRFAPSTELLSNADLEAIQYALEDHDADSYQPVMFEADRVSALAVLSGPNRGAVITVPDGSLFRDGSQWIQTQLAR